MKVVLLSTYPPRKCGIATYTAKLARALASVNKDSQIVVISEETGKEGTEPYRVYPVFKIGSDFSSEILKKIDEIAPDVVHIQHVHDIFGMSCALFKLLEGLKKRKICVIVTLHTVYTVLGGLLDLKPLAFLFNRKIGRFADRIIVHQETCARTLFFHGVNPEKVSVIAHFTENRMNGDGGKIRARLNISRDAKVLLFFGFIRIKKNIQVILKALPDIIKRVPNTYLIIAGSIPVSWYYKLYNGYLRSLIKKHGLGNNVCMVNSFISEEETADYFAAADVVLLPHSQWYGSSSGVSHQALAAGKPMVCSDTSKFEEIKNNISEQVVADPRHPSEWSDAICSLLSDVQLETRIINKINSFAEKTNIREIAKEHFNTYFLT